MSCLRPVACLEVMPAAQPDDVMVVWVQLDGAVKIRLGAAEVTEPIQAHPVARRIIWVEPVKLHAEIKPGHGLARERFIARVSLPALQTPCLGDVRCEFEVFWIE